MSMPGGTGPRFDKIPTITVTEEGIEISDCYVDFTLRVPKGYPVIMHFCFVAEKFKIELI